MASIARCRPYLRLYTSNLTLPPYVTASFDAAFGRNQNESSTDFTDYHRFLKKGHKAKGREVATAGVAAPS